MLLFIAQKCYVSMTIRFNYFNEYTPQNLVTAEEVSQHIGMLVFGLFECG
jgi:hypothetical protein